MGQHSQNLRLLSRARTDSPICPEFPKYRRFDYSAVGEHQASESARPAVSIYVCAAKVSTADVDDTGGEIYQGDICVALRPPS